VSGLYQLTQAEAQKIQWKELNTAAMLRDRMDQIFLNEILQIVGKNSKINPIKYAELIKNQAPAQSIQELISRILTAHGYHVSVGPGQESVPTFHISYDPNLEPVNITDLMIIICQKLNRHGYPTDFELIPFRGRD
jgi:hypothetical protein